MFSIIVTVLFVIKIFKRFLNFMVVDVLQQGSQLRFSEARF